MKTRVLTGILVSGILIFGLMSGVPSVSAQDEISQQNAQKSEEETLNKIAQDLWLANMFVKLAAEENVVFETIVRLEAFQTDDPVLQNKIRNNWLPFLGEYLKIIGDVQSVVEKFGKREDLIPEVEIAAEFRKVYPLNTGARVKQIAEEMAAAGILEKLFKN